MSELLELSALYIDEGRYEGPASVNRVTGRLSEVADGIAMVEAFSHVVAVDAGSELVIFDTSLAAFGPSAAAELRNWSHSELGTIVYTHGHLDHVGGVRAFLDSARELGHRRPAIVGHSNVPTRFDRYELTAGYNTVINQRQFGGTALVGRGSGSLWPSSWVRPSVTYDTKMQLRAGDMVIELRHDRGETDDHTWAWIPDRRAIVSGDFLCWVFPNAGNPQKVQRYPTDWARALRAMAALEPELLLPAHGLPIAGAQRIRGVLDDVATSLETLVSQTLDLMNEGAPLDRILSEVRLPAELTEKPYLRPVYDEPEFVVRNIWRLYGGWYDGDPANLKPAPAASLAAEVASLAGGPMALARRGEELAAGGDLRLACHLVEMAGLAAPDDPEVHGIRADVYRQRRKAESSLMARGIYGDAAARSAAIAEASGETGG